MHETAEMLEARLALVDWIRVAEYDAARDERVREAAALVRSRSHELGNHVQIVKLSALEIERRSGGPEIAELVADLHASAEQAGEALAALLAVAQLDARTGAGVEVAPCVRAAIELARPAIAPRIVLQIDAHETTRTHATARELEAIVLAIALDAHAATRIAITLRERAIEGKPWLELLRVDDRRETIPARPFELPSLLHVVDRFALRLGGEATLAQGRTGLELVVALPVLQSSSSS